MTLFHDSANRLTKGRVVCHICGSDVEIRWIRTGKMKWVKEGGGARDGRMLRFFCSKCRRFVKPYPPGHQAKMDNWRQ